TAVSDAGQTTRYGYDDLNRLVSVVSVAGTCSYEYDAFGNRVAATENGQRTTYLLDPTGLANVAAQYDGTGSLEARYVHSGAALVSRIDVSGASTYYDFDAIGSTAGLTNGDGQYVNQYSYLPFGESLQSTETVGNPFTYVGQFGVMGETNGLQFMR